MIALLSQWHQAHWWTNRIDILCEYKRSVGGRCPSYNNLMEMRDIAPVFTVVTPVRSLLLSHIWTGMTNNPPDLFHTPHMDCLGKSNEYILQGLVR